MSLEANKVSCPSPEISAYLDGELSADAEMQLDMHLAGCAVCTEELNLQKNFLNTLNFSLDSQEGIELPEDFTKAIVANAESSVSGLRRPNEWRNAALICAGLVLCSVLALGSNAEKTFTGMAIGADKLVVLVSSIGHFVFDVALGSTIVFRSLASKFVFESNATVILFLVVFVSSLYLFSRLLVRFHRG